MRSYKWWVMLVALVLGLGAPVGSILFRALQAGPFSFQWIQYEIRTNSFYYAYMAFGTPLIFACFGLFAGFFVDRFFQQRADLEMLNLQLKEQSIMDDLTGLYNHRHILVEIEKEIERARRYKHPLAGMMIDVDDFKRFNDKYGHLTGDYVLREVAHIFDQSIRKIDIIGRYGGDEFLIILPESAFDNAKVVAHRIQKNLATHEFLVKDRPMKVTASIGLFGFGDLTDLEATGFIEKVDQALLKAKALGKNRVLAVSGD